MGVEPRPEGNMTEAVIVDCLRTAIGKAPKGKLRTTRPDDLAAAVIRRLLEKHPAVLPDEVDDVILGCANPEGESGMNMARVACAAVCVAANSTCLFSLSNSSLVPSILVWRSLYSCR